MENMLSDEPGLKIVKEYTYENGAIYRGQMKKQESQGQDYGEEEEENVMIRQGYGV